MPSLMKGLTFSHVYHFSAMFSQLMESAEPWFSTFEHDGQKVNLIIQIFFF